MFGGLGSLLAGLWLIGAQRPDEQRDPVARKRETAMGLGGVLLGAGLVLFFVGAATLR